MNAGLHIGIAAAALLIPTALTGTWVAAAGTRLEAAVALEPGADDGASVARLVDQNAMAFAYRAATAAAAERSLDVQYYIWHDDLTGRIFANALLRAADRGVRVRVLLDDVGAQANDENLLSIQPEI